MIGAPGILRVPSDILVGLALYLVACVLIGILMEKRR